MAQNSFNSNGQCLCGGVRFQAAAEAAEAGICHCKMCRRWTGGAQIALQARISLQEDKTLSWWKGSPWGERGFCSACGSSLFWRLQMEDNGVWMVLAGALDSEDGLTLAKHIFYDDKAPFYEFADDAPRISGAEFTAETFNNLHHLYGDEFLQSALAQLRQHSGDAFADKVEKLLAAQ